jgi:6-phosphogluconate dehydrogenase, C-terminal domain
MRCRRQIPDTPAPPWPLAPIVYTLWQEFLRYDPADPLWPNLAAYAEGFDILKRADSDARPPEERFALNLADIAEVWRRGSVISSWLLDLTASALEQDPKLEGYSGYVEDSGEGRWTIMAAIEQAVSADFRRALRALSLAPPAHLRGAGSLGHAQRFRRPDRA